MTPTPPGGRAVTTPPPGDESHTAQAPDRLLATRPWLALGALAVAQFMVFLDETVVNVALPSIKGDLGFSQDTLAWVVNAYMLLFGGLLLLGGRAADLFGRRRVFLAGTALFGVASLLNGVAQTQGMLIAARGLQGLGAALATPAALSLVTAIFPAGAQRMKALGIWGALSGLGFASGIILGGVLTDLASWRWVFLVNVPVALAALVALPRLVGESRTGKGPRFDVAGALAVTGGMTTLVYVLVNAPTENWRRPDAYGPVAAAVLLLAGFVWIELRSAAPLIPAALVRRRMSLVPNVLQMLLGASIISSFFLLTLYIQQVLRYSPLRAGLAYLPLAAGVVGAIAVANRLMGRIGPRILGAAGLTLAASGLLVFGHSPVRGSYLDLLPGLLLQGVGAGLAFVSITTAALARVEDAVSGVASGLLSTAVMLGGAVGLAGLSGIANARTSGLLGSDVAPLAAQVSGLRLSFLLASLGALVAAFVAITALEQRSRESELSAGSNPND